MAQTSLHMINNTADVYSLSKRPAEHQWETGVAPLSAGLCFFLLGIPDLLKDVLLTDLAYAGLKFLGVFAVPALLWGARTISNRIVSPRCGYVEPAQPQWLKWFLWLSLPMLGVPLVLAYVLNPVGSPPVLNFVDGRLIVPGLAVLIATLSLYFGRMRKMPVLFGIYMLSLALVIWWLPLSATERAGMLQSGTGGPLAILGAIRVRASLKANPKPVDLTNDG